MKTALITGVSSGLGREFAKIFAAEGYSLVVVARNKERLENTASQLMTDYGIHVTAIPADLSDVHAAEQIYREVSEKGLA